MARALKVCCIALAIFLTAVATVVVSGKYFHVSYSYTPEITAQPIVLENEQLGLSPNGSSSGMLVTTENPNYRRFEYYNSIAHVNYCGIIIGEVPIERRKIPGRTKVNITRIANLMTDKMIAAPGIADDFLAGHLEMVSTAKLPGKSCCA